MRRCLHLSVHFDLKQVGMARFGAGGSALARFRFAGIIINQSDSRDITVIRSRYSQLLRIRGNARRHGNVGNRRCSLIDICAVDLCRTIAKRIPMRSSIGINIVFRCERQCKLKLRILRCCGEIVTERNRPLDILPLAAVRGSIVKCARICTRVRVYVDLSFCVHERNVGIGKVADRGKGNRIENRRIRVNGITRRIVETLVDKGVAAECIG